MTGDMPMRMSEGQREPFKRSKCEQCQTEFEAKNRNGLSVRFCKDACRVAWHNAERKQLVHEKRREKRRARPRRAPLTLNELSASLGLPSGCYPAGALGLTRRSFDNRVSQGIALDLIPASERPALLAQAAERFGLTEGPVLKAARAVKAICQQPGVQRLLKSDEAKIQELIEQTTDPERRLKLEAMLGVLQAHYGAAA